MKRAISAMALTTLVVVLGVSTTLVGAEEGATAKSIMGKLTKGPKSAAGKLKTALKATPADWAEIKAAGKEFGEFGPELPKTKAPKGEQADFEKLASAFASESTALAKAAAKEDLEGVNAAFGKINGSCAGCHKGHKP